MLKFAKVFGVVVVLLLLATAYLYFGVNQRPMPWKVTDPHNSGFVEEDFRFTDYYGRDGRKQLQEALRVMFPVGTPKEKVDRILYENQPKYTPETKWGAERKKGNPNPRKPHEKNIYIYHYVPYPHAINMFVVSVFYDSNDLVKEVTDHGEPLHNRDGFYEGE